MNAGVTRLTRKTRKITESRLMAVPGLRGGNGCEAGTRLSPGPLTRKSRFGVSSRERRLVGPCCVTYRQSPPLHAFGRRDAYDTMDPWRSSSTRQPVRSTDYEADA